MNDSHVHLAERVVVGVDLSQALVPRRTTRRGTQNDYIKRTFHDCCPPPPPHGATLERQLGTYRTTALEYWPRLWELSAA